MAQLNTVLEGKYKDKKVTCGTQLRIDLNPLNKYNISSYTVIDETNKDKYSVWKGALGVALLGGIRAVAGIRGKYAFYIQSHSMLLLEVAFMLVWLPASIDCHVFWHGRNRTVFLNLV